jgi:hypothetical protein
MPTPARDRYTLEWTVRRPEGISLVLYDVGGRKIEDIIEHTVMAPGTYRLKRRVGALPTGVYLYRLTSGSGVASWKLIVRQ